MEQHQKWKPWAIGIAILVFLVGGLSALAYVRSNQKLAKIRELQQQAFSRDSDLPKEERDRLREQLKEEYENLSDRQKEQLRAEWQERFAEGFERRMKEREEELDQFFAKPPAEQIAYLDERIDRSLEYEARRQQQQATQGPRPPRTGGPGGQGGSGGGNASSSNKGQSQGNRGGGEASSFFSNLMSRIEPKTRAKMDEYQRRMDERRAERGLPAESRRRRGPR